MEAAQNFFQTLIRMGWSDYLDIFVVAFLIYSLLPHIKTPSVMKIVRLIVALVLVTWITEVMGLYTLNWILNQLLAVGLVAFVVLFQPELRKLVFLVIGTNRFGTKKPVRDIECVIKETVSACELMTLGKDKYNDKYLKKKDAAKSAVQEKPEEPTSENNYVGAVAMFKNAKMMQEWFDADTSFESILNKETAYNYLYLDKKKLNEKYADPLKKGHVGALIVFERSSPLTEWIDPGTPMDCLINQKTLCSIFYPINPLHDAAAIVRNGRIAAACCKLPLTKNPKYTGKYGTRHCAAVGITEVTDAVAVVTSEESGKISVAIDGELFVLDELQKGKLFSLEALNIVAKSREEMLNKCLKETLLPKDDDKKNKDIITMAKKIFSLDTRRDDNEA